MKHDLKAGDKVQVIRSHGTLPMGAIRTVYALRERDGYDYVYFSEEDVKNLYGWDIDRFVKYEEKEQPMKIDMNKKYRRVGTHEPVRVICVDRKVDDDSLPCVGLILTKPRVEAMVYFDHEGVDQYGQKAIEEVPAVDWSKVKMDTPMWVSFFGESGTWHKRHFNKFDGKRVHFWPNGYTSFTSRQTCDANSELPEQCSLEEPK